MQKLNRKTMLLKPVSSSRYKTAVLRLQQIGQGVSLSIEYDKRQSGDLKLFLYSKNGINEAGNLKEGCLFTTIYEISFESIYAAAIFEGGSLVLKSGSISAYDAKEKHKTHMQKIQKEKVSIYAPQEPQDIFIEPAEDIEAPPGAYEPWAAEPQTDPGDQSNVYYKTQKTVSREEPVQRYHVPDSYESIKNISNECPNPTSALKITPFENVFQRSSFTKYTYDSPGGQWHYITGVVMIGEEQVEVIGVPGRFAPSPPPWLKGFKTHLVSSEGIGYWLMFYNSQTKEPRFPLQSRRDG